jgi:hypothetical protein
MDIIVSIYRGYLPSSPYMAKLVVLLLTPRTYLPICLNKTWGYCKSWGLEINYTKSKVMIFNKGSRLSNVK